ncbi:ABC transporter permease [Xylophilus rhododendri]|uniref:Transport permease protein n=1 Tax=Xylophilus rhododendri TaxID=2697032 RepID=A0A857J3V9_9BURK|nr:ABC transporter permease [Xylophilus rhododendri]QHI97923.1 ABC transporter permease [Xylophilus rhododendri]
MIKWFLTGLWEFKLVLVHFIQQHVTLRYRRTALGFMWTLVNPLLTMAITSVVFSLMMRMPVKSFAVFLFAGLIPWTLFSGCVIQGGGGILENESLIKKIYIPRQIFVISRCCGLLVDALLSFACLFILALLLGAQMTIALITIPLAFLLVFLFAVGMALAMSVLTVYARDAQHIVSIALQAGYYLTPIIYPLEIIPEKYHWIVATNPLYYFIDLFRAPIYSGEFPSLHSYSVAAMCAVGSLLIGMYIFRRFDREVIFRL